MLWWMCWMGNQMGEALVLTAMVSLVSGDPAHWAQNLWTMLDAVDPQIAFVFYVTWWFMAVRLMRDMLANALGVSA